MLALDLGVPLISGAGPGSRAGLCLGKARPAQAGPTAAGAQIRMAHASTETSARRSRLPPAFHCPAPGRSLGRSLQSRRMRSASPNLDTASTRAVFGACGEDGESQHSQACHPFRLICGPHRFPATGAVRCSPARGGSAPVMDGQLAAVIAGLRSGHRSCSKRLAICSAWSAKARHRLILVR
jgi:hypothetical protein